MRILLVEDAQIERDMLARALRREGFVVREAKDGRAAVEDARASVPDLIIMDTTLPGMDCYEATQAIKADPATSHIPVLILSSHGAPSDQAKAIEAGCDDYDFRPINMTRLLRKLASLGEKAKRHAPRPQPPQEPDSESGVLVVDLNPEPDRKLAKALKAHGLKVKLTSNGSDAVEFLRLGKTGLVIFDARAEAAPARILIRQLQDDEQLSGQRFVVLTSTASYQELRSKVALKPRQVMIDPDLDDVLLRVEVRASGKR